jgi:hypothetical protein
MVLPSKSCVKPSSAAEAGRMERIRRADRRRWSFIGVSEYERKRRGANRELL